jgi:hypothetical protein
MNVEYLKRNPSVLDGTQEQWTLPTPDEVTLQTVLGTNHGALGVCNRPSSRIYRFPLLRMLDMKIGIIPWDSPYSSSPEPGIAQAISQIAPIFAQKLTPIIANHTATRASLPSNASQVDVAMWTVLLSDGTARTLIMLANLNYGNVVAAVETSFDFGGSEGGLQTLFGQGSVVNGKLVAGMGSTGIAGFVVEHAASGGSGGKKNGSGRVDVGRNLVLGSVVLVVMVVGVLGVI